MRHQDSLLNETYWITSFLVLLAIALLLNAFASMIRKRKNLPRSNGQAFNSSTVVMTTINFNESTANQSRVIRVQAPDGEVTVNTFKDLPPPL